MSLEDAARTLDAFSTFGFTPSAQLLSVLTARTLPLLQQAAAGSAPTLAAGGEAAVVAEPEAAAQEKAVQATESAVQEASAVQAAAAPSVMVSLLMGLWRGGAMPPGEWLAAWGSCLGEGALSQLEDGEVGVPAGGSSSCVLLLSSMCAL